MSDFKVGQHVTVKLSGGRLVVAEIKAWLAASFLLNESVSEPEKSRNKVTYSLVPLHQPPFEDSAGAIGAGRTFRLRPRVSSRL